MNSDLAAAIGWAVSLITVAVLAYGVGYGVAWRTHLKRMNAVTRALERLERDPGSQAARREARKVLYGEEAK